MKLNASAVIFILMGLLWSLPYALADDEWKGSYTKIDPKTQGPSDDMDYNPTFSGTYIKNGNTTIKQGTEIADPQVFQNGTVPAGALPLLIRHVVSTSVNGTVVSSESYSSPWQQTQTETTTDVKPGITISKRK